MVRNTIATILLLCSTALAQPTSVPLSENSLRIDGVALTFSPDYYATDVGAFLLNTGTTQQVALTYESSDTPTNGQVLKFNTGGTFTWEDDATGSAAGESPQWIVFAPDQEHTTGDGKVPLLVPSTWNGWEIKSVKAFVPTAGTTGTLDLVIRRVRGGTPADVTDSFSVTSGSNLQAASIDLANDDLATDDVLWVDIDATHTTPGSGLNVLFIVGPP